jgi:hypothetical protein
MLGLNPEGIRTIPQLLNDDEIRPTREIPQWEGLAGTRAARIIESFVVSRARA